MCLRLMHLHISRVKNGQNEKTNKNVKDRLQLRGDRTGSLNPGGDPVHYLTRDLVSRATRSDPKTLNFSNYIAGLVGRFTECSKGSRGSKCRNHIPVRAKNDLSKLETNRTDGTGSFGSFGSLFQPGHRIIRKIRC